MSACYRRFLTPLLLLFNVAVLCGPAPASAAVHARLTLHIESDFQNDGPYDFDLTTRDGTFAPDAVDADQDGKVDYLGMNFTGFELPGRSRILHTFWISTQPLGTNLSVGDYSDTRSIPEAGHPTLGVFATPGGSKPNGEGSFHIDALQIDYADRSPRLVKLSVTFRMHSSGRTEPLTGTLEYEDSTATPARGPNLAGTWISVIPHSVTTGGAPRTLVDVRFSVQNIGVRTGGSSGTGFYLVDNLTGEKKRLKRVPTPPLRSYRWAQLELSLLLPAKVTLGGHHLVAVVDDTRRVKEGDEHDNVTTSP